MTGRGITAMSETAIRVAPAAEMYALPTPLTVTDQVLHTYQHISVIETTATTTAMIGAEDDESETMTATLAATMTVIGAVTVESHLHVRDVTRDETDHR